MPRPKHTVTYRLRMWRKRRKRHMKAVNARLDAFAALHRARLAEKGGANGEAFDAASRDGAPAVLGR